jgi:hypothetical protein
MKLTGSVENIVYGSQTYKPIDKAAQVVNH